jgi:hypothetical protein
MSKLQIKSPVPSDIEIAQSVEPVPVRQLADKLGILEDELDLYGKHKAKVHLSVLDRLKVSTPPPLPPVFSFIQIILDFKLNFWFHSIIITSHT